MKSKRVKLLTAVSLAVILIAAGVYAAVSDQLSYVEKFETDKVDIRLQQLTIGENGETEAVEELVEANKDVSYIPRIKNEGADCYLRAKVEVTMDGECEEPLGIEHIYGLGPEWVLRGDYFYCTEILTAEKEIDLFKGLHIPEDWEYDDADGFSIKVRAEAIQSANLNVDFREELPWGSVSLQSAALAEDVELMEAVPVSYISDAEFTSDGGFQCSSADLFDEFGGMMPGDCFKKTVNIKNSADNPMKVSLKVASGDNELNKKINIKITAGGHEVYSGIAAEADRLHVMELTEIPEGGTGAVDLQMHLPADVDNDYTEMEDDIVWELAVEELVKESPQTGDDFNLILFMLISMTALLVMVVQILYGRRGRYETTH